MAAPISPFVNELDRLNNPVASSPSSVFAPIQDIGGAPTLTKLAMGGAPPVFADAPTPQITREPTPIEQQIDETGQQLKKLQTPYDSSQHSKLRNFGHVAATIGNIAGDIFAPRTMELIPGTQLNRAVQEGGLSSRLQDLTQQQSEDESRDATTDKTNAATRNLPQQEADQHALSTATTHNLTSEATDRDATAANPSLAVAYAHAVQDALKNGRDPSKDPVVQHLSDSIVALQPGQNKTPEAPKTIQLEVGGKPHQMGWNPQTNKYDIDMGESGEKPPTVNVNAGRAAKNDVLKAYQPTLDAAQRMNIMTDNYEKAVKDHDQQAMLSLLANHIGMTLGAQKGARITKDILHEAQESRPWLQGIKAKFDSDGVLSGVTLTPSQMRQMVGLGQSMYQESAKKSRAAAQYLGSDDDGPERVPGAATIRYYIGLANGDQAKAKELAKADGWSVK